MESLDPIYSDSKLRKYDLKGSTSDRSNIKPEDLSKITKQDTVEDVMLDNDFTEVRRRLFFLPKRLKKESCSRRRPLMS